MAEPHTLVDGLVFGEGPRWRHDRLWLSDMFGEAVLTVSLEGHVETAVRLPGRKPSGLGWLPDGTLLVVSMEEPAVLRVDRGVVSVHARLDHLVDCECNDMVVDARGNAYVGTYPNPATDPGPLLLVRPDGTAEVAATGLRFCNGTVVRPDGASLIIGESLGSCLTEFTIAADGTLHDRRTFAETDGAGPDGCCLDVEGAVWAAIPMAGEFRRIAPGGEVLDRFEVPGRRAIACTLGGPDLRTLFLVSSLHLPGPDLVGTHDARIDVVEVAVAGTGSP
ncbi:MAG: SMP-30/gluconolactonase/LRE family protein [Actinomycetes bacterium]